MKFPAIRDIQVKAENDIPATGDEHVNNIDSVVFTRSISEGTDIKGNYRSYVRLDKSSHLTVYTESCRLDVFLFIGRISKYQSYQSSQCYTSSAPYDGDRLDNPIWLIGWMTGDECRKYCDDISIKDSHGRSCIAYEHSSQNHADMANCALAWACDFTKPWNGGATYIKNGYVVLVTVVS